MKTKKENKKPAEVIGLENKKEILLDFINKKGSKFFDDWMNGKLKNIDGKLKSV